MPKETQMMIIRKELYAFRYDGDTSNIDAFVAAVKNKQMPDPAIAVTPINWKASNFGK